MHNGQIGGWPRVRRVLESHIPDSYYAGRNGTTDSEVIFLLLLAFGFAADAEGAFAQVVDLIEHHMASSAVNEPFRFTAAMSDGEKLYAIRYASDARPPTLYLNARAPGHGALVVSEPIDDASIGWDSVPPQSFVRIDRAGIGVSPFRRS
jgi:glutamine amidotransferase